MEYPDTFTGDHAREMIRKIADTPPNQYAKNPEGDIYLRLRDIALISFLFLFFKRVSEILRLKLSDIRSDGSYLIVTFRVQKKLKRKRECVCKARNALKAKFCSVCGKTLEDSTIVDMGTRQNEYVKYKTLKSEFAQHIMAWVDTARALGASESSYVFAPFAPLGSTFRWYAHITPDMSNRILQRLDPTMTNHSARYGGAERELKRRPVQEVKELGDWERLETVFGYAQRKGLTDAQKKFRDDLE